MKKKDEFDSTFVRFWKITCKSSAPVFSTISKFPLCKMSLIRSPALFVAVTEVAKTCKNEGVAVDMVLEILENLNAE